MSTIHPSGLQAGEMYEVEIRPTMLGERILECELQLRAAKVGAGASHSPVVVLIEFLDIFHFLRVISAEVHLCRARLLLRLLQCLGLPIVICWFGPTILCIHL